MNYRLSAACAAGAALALAFAGSAFADGRASATLATSLGSPSKVIAGGAVWNCAESACVSAVAPDDAQTVDACKALVRKVGPVTAYGESKPLDEKALAKCNLAAKAPAAAATASR